MRNIIEQEMFLHSSVGSKCVATIREARQRMSEAQYRQSRALNDAEDALAVGDKTEARLASEDAETEQHILRHAVEVLNTHMDLTASFHRERRRDTLGHPVPNRHERRRHVRISR